MPLERLEHSVTIYFDDSLPALAKVIADDLGKELLEKGVVLRDTTGRLCFFAPLEIEAKRQQDIAKKITGVLGRYARPDRVIAGIGEFGVDDILGNADAIPMKVSEFTIRLIDRRLVGADWLRTPASRFKNSHRFVFASLKGGVGRSTALSVVAAHEASRGRRVLAVDLDMEAPGLGSMLLSRDITPKFGMIDALVERALGPLDSAFLADLVGASTLTDRGRIDVIPAFGARSLENPAEILAKIARAYGEVVHEDGSFDSILDQISDIIKAVENTNQYDIVLIDARAGLHETAAAALLGLGAEVLCFGIDEPQTFDGYRALFSHVDRYTGSSEVEQDWLSRVTLVQAKAPPDTEMREEFAERCRRMLSGVDLSANSNPVAEVKLPEGFREVDWDESVTDFDLGLTEAASGANVIAIMYDANFAGFAPLAKRDQISEAIYRATYGDLLEYVAQGVEKSEGAV